MAVVFLADKRNRNIGFVGVKYSCGQLSAVRGGETYLDTELNFFVIMNGVVIVVEEEGGSVHTAEARQNDRAAT